MWAPDVPLSDQPGSGSAWHRDGLRGIDGAVWRIQTAPGGCFYEVTRDGEVVPHLGGDRDMSDAGIRAYALGMEQ